MQLCEEVADGLVARGHELAVLTSTRRDGPENWRPYPVHRLLTIDPDWHIGQSAAQQFFLGRRQRESNAIAHLKHLVESYQPQVFFIWHATGLPRVLLRAAEQQAPTVYYLAGYLPEQPDEYIAYWQAQPIRGVMRLLKRPLAKVALAILRREGKPVPLKYEHVICVSGYVRKRLVEQGLIPSSTAVIHNGVDLSVFSPSRLTRRFVHENGVSCLVAGRIVPEKGIHTVIDAFARLSNGEDTFRLTILGDGPPNYIAYLQGKIQTYGIGNVVCFQPSVPRYKMPRILDQHDVLFLPSEYAEPIARSMQEAMAMGLLVIGTTTGGSGELLVHEQTGLVFEAGDARSLAEQIMRTIEEPNLVAQWALAGQTRVRDVFSIEQTIDKVADYLQALLEQNA